MSKIDLHILMLEDELLDAELNIAQLALLDEYNCIVDLVGDKNSFLKALETTAPDLVLSDYNLPQYDGLQALNDLKARSPLIPFIFVTGTLNEETAVETIKAGAWDYVVKDRLFRLPLAVRSVLKLKEEKQLVAMAEEKARRLLTAIEQTSAQIIVTNENGIIEYVNSRFTEITGHKSEDIIGTKANFLSPDDSNLGINSRATEELRNGLVFRGEAISKKKDGTDFWELISITPIKNAENKITSFVTVKEDITNRKMIEQELINALDKAERSDKLKDAFLQNLSHEIRTPLNAIVGFSDLLQSKESSSTETINNYTSIIKNSSHQLLAIVSDVLTISSIQTGQETVINNLVDIDTLFDNLCEVYKPLAHIKKIEIVFKKSGMDEKLRVITDETKLNQILSILLDNAIKYTHEGSVVLQYSIQDNSIIFSVKDTGIGIAKEAQGYIFERFRQADTSIHTNYGGTGLGLSISASFVKMLKGEIWVDSAPGKGSTFYFSIPYLVKEIKDSDAKPGHIGLIKKNLTVLIAEDEYYNYLVLEEYLKEQNVTILHANNGLEAIKMCQADPSIDLVLMDIKMPVMDGVLAFKEIRKIRPNLPIIAQTAYALEKEKGQFLEMGFNNYIAKPLVKDALLNIINKTILATV